ncbi:MAG: hypothetical protein ABWJ90_02975 [Thermus sp.]|uniref:hypothetical protein n=1 Tax=Thermus sp. TaxID=275 RepID=UPI00351B2520
MWGLRLLAALSLLFPGFSFSPSPGKEEAGLVAKGPVPVLKEERSVSPFPVFLGGGVRPRHPTLPSPPPLYPRPLPETLPAPSLYLLYGRLQLEGG